MVIKSGDSCEKIAVLYIFINVLICIIMPEAHTTNLTSIYCLDCQPKSSGPSMAYLPTRTQLQENIRLNGLHVDISLENQAKQVLNVTTHDKIEHSALNEKLKIHAPDLIQAVIPVLSEDSIHKNGHIESGKEFEKTPWVLETKSTGNGLGSSKRFLNIALIKNGGTDSSYTPDRTDYRDVAYHNRKAFSNTKNLFGSIGRQLEPIYGYYYIERRLWYVPLYFSIYFVMYIGSLVIKALSRHRVFFPQTVSAVVP